MAKSERKCWTGFHRRCRRPSRNHNGLACFEYKQRKGEQCPHPRFENAARDIVLRISIISSEARAMIALFTVSCGTRDVRPRRENPRLMTVRPAWHRSTIFFTNEVWAKVGAQACLECPQAGRGCRRQQFHIGRTPTGSLMASKNRAMRRNRDQFVIMARRMEGDQSRLLLKVTGKIRHGGKSRAQA